MSAHLFMGIPAGQFKRADGKPVVQAKSAIPQLTVVAMAGPTQTTAAAVPQTKTTHLPAQTTQSVVVSNSVARATQSESHDRSGSASQRHFKDRYFWPTGDDYCD